MQAVQLMSWRKVYLQGNSARTENVIGARGCHKRGNYINCWQMPRTLTAHLKEVLTVLLMPLRTLLINMFKSGWTVIQLDLEAEKVRKFEITAANLPDFVLQRLLINGSLGYTSTGLFCVYQVDNARRWTSRQGCCVVSLTLHSLLFWLDVSDYFFVPIQATLTRTTPYLVSTCWISRCK